MFTAPGKRRMRESVLGLLHELSIVQSGPPGRPRTGLKPVLPAHTSYARAGWGFPRAGVQEERYRWSVRCWGKYHPHGDSAVSTNSIGPHVFSRPRCAYPLVEREGELRPIDGDSAGGPNRYTEARLKAAGTIEHLAPTSTRRPSASIPNSTGSGKSTTVLLPAGCRNLLIQRFLPGLAVGMATNIPPPNSEVVGGDRGPSIKDPGSAPQAMRRR